MFSPYQNTNIFRGNIDIAQTDFEKNQADFSEKLFHFQSNVNIFPTNKKNPKLKCRKKQHYVC